MHEGPRDTEKKSHAELSEGLVAPDQWVDIFRKTLVVAIVTVTVWAGCVLMRRAVEFGTGRLFETAEKYGSSWASCSSRALPGACCCSDPPGETRKVMASTGRSFVFTARIRETAKIRQIGTPNRRSRTPCARSS